MAGRAPHGEVPPGAGSVVIPAAGKRLGGKDRGALGATVLRFPDADSKTLVFGNRTCLTSVSLLEIAYGGGTTKAITSDYEFCLKSS